MPVSRVRAALGAGGLAAALALTSCAPGTPADPAPSVSGPTFVYLTADPIGQNGFFTSGKAGIEAVARSFDGKPRTLEATDESTRRANLEAAVAEAPEVIVMLGASFAEPARTVAEQNPQQRFLLIDTTVEGAPENLYQATFREHEAAYLLGVEAARLTSTQRIGSVLAEDTPLLHKYAQGFAAGAQRVSPDIQVLASPVIGAEQAPYANPERGAELASGLARDGADQVFGVAARSNEGVIEAAKAQGFAAYGVDENQCPIAPGSVVDGTVKSVDTVITTVVGQIMAGKSSSEATASFGLAEGGMTLVSLTPDAEKSECTIMDHPEVLAEVAQLRDEIVAGTLKIPNPAA